jgi:hypothetical protein
MPDYWSSSHVLAGVSPASSSERNGFPAYIVKVDGEAVSVSNRRSLDKLLGEIYAERPRVFVNAGKGVTIDFDTK